MWRERACMSCAWLEHGSSRRSTWLRVGGVGGVGGARLEEEEHPCEGLVRVGHGDDLVVDVGVGQARLECVLRR